MLDAGRHRKISPSGQWQGVRPTVRRGGTGRHHRSIPKTFRTKAIQALLPSATVLALAAAPAHADAPEPVRAEIPPLPVQIDPLAGLSQNLWADIDALKTLNFTDVDLNGIGLPGIDLPGVNLPALFAPDTAIVVLGYGLEPDGQMRPELMARLYAGYVSALLSPQAPIIVTGGNPQNGVTEADAMADWLVDHGIDRARIHTETRANSTIQNATFSAQLMDIIGAHAAILITSADHIARALSNFQAAGISVVATMTPDAAPLAAVPFGPHN
ncbi:YdcF family protein [Nocardia sp. CDC153]|uniref:YdcF family protein n=1 Tax=Nocardia sp. CDC153 TaxID=3112167 RepID=UPI002DB9590A|nr:YdcF family protein [Nocardia sp. CDC153]MEC3958387.1 YdcF family protein [Nocardia sp. CDC153]